MKGKLLGILCVMYVLFLLYASLMPFDLYAGWDEVANHFDLAWKYWPFGQRHTSLIDIASNLALYIPLGLLVAMWAAPRCGPRRPWPFLSAVLAAAAVSVAVEIIQLFSISRTTGAHDLLMNTAGGAAGAAVGTFLGQPAWTAIGRELRLRWASRRISLVAWLLLLLLVAEALFPFRPTLDVSQVRRNLRNSPIGLQEAIAAHPWYHWVLWRGGVYAVLAVLLAASSVLPSRLRWLRGAAAAIGFAAIVEMSKVFVVSRHANIANVLASACGAAAGALLGLVVAGRRRCRHPASEVPP